MFFVPVKSYVHSLVPHTNAILSAPNTILPSSISLKFQIDLGEFKTYLWTSIPYCKTSKLQIETLGYAPCPKSIGIGNSPHHITAPASSSPTKSKNKIHNFHIISRMTDFYLPLPKPT